MIHHFDKMLLLCGTPTLMQIYFTQFLLKLIKINWLRPKMNNHFFIKAQGLRQIFTLVVQSLQQQFLHTDLNLLSREDILALLSLVSLAEQILSWDFSLYHILSKN